MTELNYNEWDDAQLLERIDVLGSQISYHYADDSTREWDLVPPLKKQFRAIEDVLKARGISVDTSNWML